ncbi:hypothetical protein C8Q80DRAFT_1265266 [Daedaleopsis nitida]|nr:hypothetical protein C8Q80DRAFT_1265266 [Daedaleopsis nitida]
MRFFWSLLPLAALAASVAAAPVDSADLAKRTCPNGRPGCGEGPVKREIVPEARSCPNGRQGCD